MEAPLSSVQEHLSAPLCSIRIHRYMWRSTSAPYCLGLNKKTKDPDDLLVRLSQVGSLHFLL